MAEHYIQSTPLVEIYLAPSNQQAGPIGEGGPPFYKQSDFWVAGFTGLLFLSTALLWWATERTIKHAGEHSERELRAYVFAEIRRVTQHAQSGAIELRLKAQNRGKTPAYNVRNKWEVEIHPYPVPGALADMTPDLSGSGADLGAGGKFASVYAHGAPNSDQLAKIIAGTHAIYVWES